MLEISLSLSLECSALSSTIMRRMCGSRPRRVDLAAAGSVAKRLTMPSFSKRSTLRYMVRSGVPVCPARSATEPPNRAKGLSSS